MLAALSLYGVQEPPKNPFELVGHVSTKNIHEPSGIVKSTRYPDTYWVHNDSGDSARIFAIHANGTVIAPPNSKTPNDGLEVQGGFNNDWEDITSDGNNLYISDMGNNRNARRDLGVYVLPEPNPTVVQKAHVLSRYPIAYPDQVDFPPEGNYDWDCEAIFYAKGKLWFLTKHRLGGTLPAKGSCLYVLDKPSVDKLNTLRKVDEKRDFGGWVTGAAMSPDGKTLAVLTEKPVKSVWLFDVARHGDKLLSGPAKRLILGVNASQCEGICFDGNNETILVNNEQGDIMRITTSQFAKP
jgi:hypothetical protein